MRDEVNANNSQAGEVDGAEVGTQRVTGAPYVYPLNTTTLTNGTHTLQIWAHDTSNTTTLSPAITLNVKN